MPTTFDDVFGGDRFLAILRGLDPAETVRACERVWAAGLRCVEVTIQTPDAVASLAAACDAAQERGLQVGAGTVTSVEQVTEVERAGATYTIAPGLDDDVALASMAAGLPHLPGVSSASEIQRARKLGLTWVKAFPAASLGPGWVSAQLAPFPWLRVVATGGIDETNAAEFLDAGAMVVGLGTSILREGTLERVLIDTAASSGQAQVAVADDPVPP